MNKEIKICEECNTPLISPRKGYVVCPNCGLVYRDDRLTSEGYLEYAPYPKIVNSRELKKLKKWDRMSYREARKLYITNYLTAVFSRFVSKNILMNIVEDIDKELNTERDKKKFHLEARFLKHLEKYVSKALINSIIIDEPVMTEYLKDYAKPTRKNRDIDSVVLSCIDKLKKFNLSYARHAKRIYQYKKALFKDCKAEIRAAVCMAYAEKSFTSKKQTRLIDYCNELGINVKSARKTLKRIETGSG